ncbi:RAS protein activator like-3 isoform X2 [Phascolarctos cinereus]|uniref:RAS protein activator like-3 isoform X2 n=1 Tax=Phascolarctos cinereus TaxID=38626 RepID=A0A6P5IS90_PHACI|nr:RAS protein activator like-3 isoform X2 [Phascolarctos cinereus]
MEMPAPTGPQAKVASPLGSYRWRRGGDKSTGASRWGRLQGWGRALSNPETSEPPASRPPQWSLFRRAVSASAKESGGGWNWKLPKYLRPGNQQQAPEHVPGSEQEVAPEPDASDPLPVTQRIPEAPTADVPVWDISGFTLLDGKLLLLGREEEVKATGRILPRAGSVGSEGSVQLTSGGSKEPEQSLRRGELEATSTNQGHNVRGLLWKRLKEKKKGKAGSTGTGCPSARGSQESLVNEGPIKELDLSSEQNVQVWPLHPSLLGEPYCFQVTWPSGSRCFSCGSAAERDRWIEDLRQSLQPQQESQEREETWLSVWVHEAKALPQGSSPGLRVELWLDGALLARTAARPGPHFWAERFHFEALPPARHLSLRLRQADRDLGNVSLALTELGPMGGGLERWFPLEGGPSGAALRARVRARCLRILPTERYKELAEFLTFHYPELCHALEPQLSAQAKEELAATMVRVLHGTGKAQALVTDLGLEELAHCGGREALLFRENTLATKAIDEYMKLVGQSYLHETLGGAVGRLCASEDGCEVDPSKCPGPALAQHQATLRQSCEDVFLSITRSSDWFPAELSAVFSSWWTACQERGAEPLGERLVCASLFLRFLCPAIMSPSLFGLAHEYPGPGLARTLTLIAKVIQNLANRALFGEKESYMSFMNDFLEQHNSAMQRFLVQVACGDGDRVPRGYQGSGDLARGLAILHVQLRTIFSDLDQPTQESLEPLPTILQAIEEGRPVPVSVSMRPHATNIRAQVHASFSEKPGFLAPRDLSKHTPLISKSQSLRSIQGQGQCEEQPAKRLRRRIQRTQSVPASRTASPHTSGPLSRTKPKDSLQRSSPPQGRSRLGVSASLPRKSSVPWQRFLEKPHEVDHSICTHRLPGKGQLAELRQEIVSLCDQQRVLAGQLEALASETQALGEQQKKLFGQLEQIQGQFRTRAQKPDPGHSPGLQSRSSENTRLESLEHRLADLERSHAQLVHWMQDQQKTPRMQIQPPKIPCANGDAT